MSWKSVAVVFLFGGALLIIMNKLKREKEESIRRQRKQQIGKMAIGGPFELLDQNGKLTKNTDFLGSWMLIYFGNLIKFAVESFDFFQMLIFFLRFHSLS